MMDLFRQEKELWEEWGTKKKAEKMKREWKKAAIAKEEAKTKIRKAEENVFRTTEKLKENYERLAARPNDHTVWKERCSLFVEYLTKWEEKLDFVMDFAEKHFVLDDLFWTSRFTFLGKIRSEVANKELECTKNFLSKGTNNYQAWSYREWIIQKNVCLWKSELQFCHEILEECKFAVSVWTQMCCAARKLNHKMGEESRFKEAKYAKEAIISNPGNDGPWTYLKVLYVEHKETLYTNPDLECIFVDVLAEVANRVTLARELDRDYSTAYSSVANRGCVNAFNLIVDLVIHGYEMKNRRLFNAVNVLFAYPHRPFCVVPSSRIQHSSEVQHLGLLSKVCAALFSLDPCRVRYCHKYRAFGRQHSLNRFYKRGEQFEKEAKHDTIRDDEKEALDDTLRDDGDDLSPQTEERFGHLLMDIVFERHPNWKNCLFQTYFKKQRRPETLEEDLKWDIRRCVVKDKGTKAGALEELRYTADIIKEDANNRRAWLHRQWVLQTFGGDLEDDDKEFEFCGGILEKDACNSFAWDHRFFVVTRLVPKLDPAANEQDMIAQQEAEYATKFILVEPENPLPWAHIFGVYTACHQPWRFKGNDDVIKAIQQVLENNNGSLLADRDVMVNARGIMNALNMLVDLVFDLKYKVWENEKFRDIMNELCPDSCFEYEWEHHTCSKVTSALKHMVKVFPDFDQSWKNATDLLVFGFK